MQAISKSTATATCAQGFPFSFVAPTRWLPLILAGCSHQQAPNYSRSGSFSLLDSFRLLLIALDQVAAQQAPAQPPPHLLEPLPLRAKVRHSLLDGPHVLDLGCHAGGEGEAGAGARVRTDF